MCLNGNYISKRKVKDKVRELERYIQENSDDEGYFGDINSSIIYAQTAILEEILKESNEELKEIIREHTLLISPYYVKENYIPVQKVKDKIKEIDKKIKYEENEKVVIYLHKQKNILQELLKSEVRVMNEEEKEAIEELEEFIKGPCETCKYCEAAYKLNRKNIIQLLNLTKKLQKENKELMGDSTLKDRTINQMNNQLKEKDEIIEKQIKAIDKMARRLTTEYHDKEWVISYYMGE